jgi:catechol 2,3-dioxygenase-like lactoylglutathione lyase family enzyme
MEHVGVVVDDLAAATFFAELVLEPQSEGRSTALGSAAWSRRRRHLAFSVANIDAVVACLRARGCELVGEVESYRDIYRLCYLRGPEGIIVELAERIG